MSGLKRANKKKDSMLMQLQFFRNSDVKVEMEGNATKEDFFFHNSSDEFIKTSLSTSAAKKFSHQINSSSAV